MSILANEYFSVIADCNGFCSFSSSFKLLTPQRYMVSLPSMCCLRTTQRLKAPSIPAHQPSCLCPHTRCMFLSSESSPVLLPRLVNPGGFLGEAVRTLPVPPFLNTKTPVLFFAQASETDQRHHRLLALPLHADVREPLLHQKVSGCAGPWLSRILPPPHRLSLRHPRGSLCCPLLSLSLIFFFFFFVLN